MLAKRLFDLICSALGLLVLLPLLAVIAVWIRLESPGPVFYRQERVGLHGRTFRIHKFRTMRSNSSGLQITVGTDPRITRAGALLRRFKLDELPQLIDVLLGKMSLVGPRPEVSRYMACYPEAIRAKVLSVRPGITDWASIHFKQESALLERSADPERAYVEEVLPIKQKYYVDYVDNRTFRGDLHILLSTVAAIVKRTP